MLSDIPHLWISDPPAPGAASYSSFISSHSVKSKAGQVGAGGDLRGEVAKLV
jgi:hypothetical protein